MSLDNASAPIESPCVNVCQLNNVDFNDPTTHCLGCFRTVAEIAQWGRMSNEQRGVIMAALPARQTALEKENE